MATTIDAPTLHRSGAGRRLKRRRPAAIVRAASGAAHG